MDGAVSESAQPLLTGASETLLIPLACRARASRDRVLRGFVDREAEAICARFGIEFDRYAADRASLLGVLHRGAYFDERCLDFLRRYPDGTVLNLGAGLNTAYERIRTRAPDGEWRWIDTDLEPVIALRESVFSDDDRRKTHSLDASDDAAFSIMIERTAGPLLVISEAVLLYVQPDDVATVFRLVGERGNAEFLFGWASPTMMRNSRKHPAMKRLRDQSVSFRSSLKRSRDIQTYHRDWRIISESSRSMTQTGPSALLLGAVYGIATFGRRLYAMAHARVK